LARVLRRLAVSIGLALVIAGNILTALATGFAAMAAARGGGSGRGIAVGLPLPRLAAPPTRTAHSRSISWLARCSSALLYSLPALQAAVSPATLFLANALVVVPVALGVRWFPEGSIDETDIFAGAGRLDMRLASGALLGVFLFFFALGAMWSYSERIGIAPRHCAWSDRHWSFDRHDGGALPALHLPACCRAGGAGCGRCC
jgi:hypothetical protein